jgi:hypothetical protein
MITNINAPGRYIFVSKYQEQHGENATIGLSPEADIILEWAGQQMDREQRIKQLAQTNPTVASAVAAVKTAEEKLQVIVALVS